MTRRKTKKKRGPLKRSIFGAFAAFTFFIIAVLWVAQIFLFGFFHYWDVKNRMAQAAYQLSPYVDEASFEEKMQTLAERERACIVVYRIRGNIAEPIADYEESPDCVVHYLNSDMVAEIAARAEVGKDVFQIRLSDLLKETKGDGASLNRDETDRLITALVTGEGEEKYILFLDASLHPVESTVMTLRYQLFYISLGLILISAIIAFVLANYISAPIENINKSAKKLAQGKFETAGIDRFYRESEELSETLSQAADELSKVDRLQKELIANISHDLRTPLTMIIGYGEVMRDIEGENTPENVQVIIDEATRLSTLVNDLLEISRIQGGNAERKDEVFDLSALARETVERYRRLKENSGFEFAEQIDEGALVKADKVKLLQVICNLINNAIHYSENEKSITVVLEKSEASLRFSVIDRGVGIATEDIENIWQRYYKVDKVHKRSSLGSGLGLSIVREILELHGARYGVKSKLGEGSVFWFELPLYKEEESILLLDE